MWYDHSPNVVVELIHTGLRVEDLSDGALRVERHLIETSQHVRLVRASCA